MLVRFLSLFCLFVGGSYAPFPVLAQQRCLLICDSLTRQPVPYATFYVVKARTGTYADDGGRVCIDKAADSATVSSVGYATAAFFIPDKTDRDTIFLARKTTFLNEVVVTNRKSRRKHTQLGYRNKNLLSENSYNPNGGYRLATFIDSEGYTSATIRRVICEVSAHKKSIISAYKVRIRLYADNPRTHVPGSDLLTESVMVDVPNVATKIDVDVSVYAIRVPERGFWIGVESVGYRVNNVDYPIDDRRYGKNSIKNDSKKTDVLSPAYVYISTESNKSVIASWNGRWTKERYMPDLAFCFSAVVDD